MNKSGGITAVCIAIIVCCVIALIQYVRAEVHTTPHIANTVILTTAKAANDMTGQIIREVQKAKPAQEWESLGQWRITEYCVHCDTTAPTASGKYPEPGMVAMNGVPLGSVISVEGEEFVVEDRCGINGTVDIFMEWPDGECHCSLLDYREVSIKR